MKIQMNDIYYKVGYSLAMRNFDLQSIETKKELENVEISLIVTDLDSLNDEYTESKNKIEILN